MDPLVALAWRGEEALLSPRVRSSSRLLDEHLAPDFSEIGQSGRLWSRAEIIPALLDETAAASEATMSDRKARSTGPDTVLLTYRLHLDGRQSWRSSLWRREGDTAQCFFHQGTTIQLASVDDEPAS